MELHKKREARRRKHQSPLLVVVCVSICASLIVAPLTAEFESEATDEATDEATAIEAIERRPLVRNLRIEPHPETPHSKQLSWELDPDSTTAIYVVRYHRPTENRDLLLQADNLTAPPLPATATRFEDLNIPDGTWYYGVVTAAEVARDGELLLRDGDNFTSTAQIVYRAAQTATTGLDRAPGTAELVDESLSRENQLQIDDLAVPLLFAVDAEESVKLSWAPVRATDIYYRVYRSLESLEQPGALERAEILATLRENVLQFEDSSPLATTAWYAVTATRRDSNEEYRQLRPNRSIVSHRFSPSVVERAEKSSAAEAALPQIADTDTGDDGRMRVSLNEVLPGAMMSWLSSRDSVQLLWVDPVIPIRDLLLYRSQRPIDSPEALRQATQIAAIPVGKASYTDSGLIPGLYFYALVPRTNLGRELPFLVEGRSYTGFAVVIRSPRLREDRRVAGRSESEAPTASTSSEKQGEEKREAPRHFSLSDDQAEQMADLNAVLARTYFVNHYSDAIRQLTPFVQSPAYEEVRARALFYSGLANFQLGDYRVAVHYFLDHNVKRYYSERADFWYRRSLDNLR